MRISDWSSDLCSSDLNEHRHDEAKIGLDVWCRCNGCRCKIGDEMKDGAEDHEIAKRHAHQEQQGAGSDKRQGQLLRSEEHTSELQSLMRISYAVFCLKKKNKKQQPTTKDRKDTT